MTQISSHRRTLKVSGMGANEWNLVQDLLGRRGGRPIRFVCCVVLANINTMDRITIIRYEK